MISVAIIAEERSRAERTAGLLEDESRVEISWTIAGKISGEFGFEDIDVVILIGDLGEPPDPVPADLPVLYIVEEIPAEKALNLLSRIVPTGIAFSDAGREELQAAISALAEGFSVAPPLFFKGAVEDDAGSSSDAPALTGRELEVLKLVSFGLANKEIAWELSISENTIKFHLSSIYAKLEVDNRVSAMRAAIELGLLDL